MRIQESGKDSGLWSLAYSTVNFSNKGKVTAFAPRDDAIPKGLANEEIEEVLVCSQALCVLCTYHNIKQFLDSSDQHLAAAPDQGNTSGGTDTGPMEPRVSNEARP
jgi:hypothetical protein